MITYVITVSRTFPATHPRRGEPTFFKEKIETAVMQYEKGHGLIEKLHTIRANYPLWKKRFDKIGAGEACLSLRYWSGKPYRSKQVEFLRLTREDGIGIQRIAMRREENISFVYSAEQINPIAHILRPIYETSIADLPYIAINDGLTPEDFIAWFAPTFEKARKKYAIWADLSTAMEMEFAVIHFTKYRY